MVAIYLPRDLVTQFNSDAIDQQAKLTLESLNSTPPPAPPEPPTPPPPSLTPPPQPADQLDRAQQPAQPQDTPPPPAPVPPSGPPALNDLLSMAGLGPTASTSTPAPTSAPTPTPDTSNSPGGPPALSDFLNFAGLGDTANAVKSAATNAASTVASTVQNAGPPALQDLMQTAGLAQPSTPAAGPAAATTPATTSPTDIMSKAQQFLGSAYVWGGKDPTTGFDCSGLAGYLEGTGQPESTTTLYGKSASVDQKDLKPGDLVFYNMGQSDMHLQHVGVYVGDGKLVQAGGTQDTVNVADVNQKVGSAPEFRRLNAGSQPTNGVPAQLASAPPDASQSVTPATQTTAGLSGGGDLSGQVGDRGQQILNGAVQAASWLGDQGQKALQAVLVTEGGLNNARGDQGKSAGPLQFYEGGQLANLAQQMGMGLDQAKNWVEQNPIAAVQWAIGTPDKPGYLGAAIQNGLSQGLSGPDLATFAQRTGQVSVSPERAGANWNSLFGAGQNVVSGAANAVQGAATQTAQDLAQSGAKLADQGQSLLNGLNTQTQSLADYTKQKLAPINAEADRLTAANQQAADQTLQANQTAMQQNSLDASQAGSGGPPGSPSKPLWQSIGDTIGNAISQGLQPLVSAFQNPTMTPPAEGGGYGSTFGNEPNPTAALNQSAQQAGQAVQSFATQGGPVGAQNAALQTIGTNVVTPVAQAIAQPGGLLAGPKTAAANALESAAQNTGNVPVLSGAASAGLQLGAGLLSSPTVLDSVTTIANIGNKYGGTPDPAAMTPEDRQAYQNAMLAVGGLVGGEGAHYDEFGVERGFTPPAAKEAPPPTPTAPVAVPFGEPTNAVEPPAGTAAAERQPSDLGPPEVAGTTRATAPAAPARTAAGETATGATEQPAAPVVQQSTDMLQSMLDEARRRGGDPATLDQMQTQIDALRPAAPEVASVAASTQSPLPSGGAQGPSGPQRGQMPLGGFGQELPTGGPRPTGNEPALPAAPPRGQLQFESQLPVGGSRPTGTESSGPAGRMPGQSGLPGLQAPTDIHPRIQQLLGTHPEYAQIAQDGLNELQAANADPATVARYFAGVERSAGLPSGVDANAWFRSLRNGAMAGGLQTLGHVMLNIPMQVLWSVPREAIAATLRGTPEQIPASVAGLFKGFEAGTEAALQQLRYGITAEDAAAGGRLRGATAGRTALPPMIGLRTDNPAAQLGGNLLSGLVGTHGAAQTLVQKVGFFQKATQLAWTQAKTEGLHGSEFSARVSDILSNLNDPQWEKIATEAQNYGDRMALRGAQGKVGTALQKVAAAGPAGNLLIPFESIANHVLTGGIEATPGAGAVGLGMDLAARARGTGPYAAGATDVARGAVTPIAERAANQILGTGVFAMGLGLAGAGILVGDGPSSPQERATALDEGQQFDGIRLGNVFVPGHMLGRLWYPLAASANVVEAQKYAKQGATPEQMIADGVQRTGTFFSNETFLRQFADLATALKDPSGKTLESFVAQLGTSFIPQAAALRDIGTITDPTARVPGTTGAFSQDVGSRIAAQMPFMRTSQPPRIEATTGQEAPNRSGWLGSLLHPAIGNDPVASEALRLELAGYPVGLAQPKANYLGVQQPPDTLATIQRTAGQAVKLYASNVINDPKYAALSDPQKADALSRAISQANEATKVTLGNSVARDPHESALLQWSQTPQYAGISSKLPPDQIAQQNWEIAQAKSKLAAYKKQYGEQAEGRLRKDDPQAYKLSQRDSLDSDVLQRRKRAIDKASGGALLQTGDTAASGGLVGAGGTTLPLTPPVVTSPTPQSAFAPRAPSALLPATPPG